MLLGKWLLFLLLLGGLFAMMRLWRGRPVRLTTATDAGHQAMRDAGSAFQAWLAVLYRDRPEAVAPLFAAIAEQAAQQDEDALTPEAVVHFESAERLDADHVFAVDWKDGESFIDYAGDMAARFGFALQWTDTERETALPDVLMQAAAPQFAARGVILYNADTGADFYWLMAVPAADRADFEAASSAWGLPVREAEQPY